MPNTKIRDISDFYLYKKKTEGTEAGGVYKMKPDLVPDGENPDTLYFVKSMDWEGIASEVVGAAIARVILGEAAPETMLLKNGQETLVASKAIPSFITIKDLSSKTGIPENCFPNGCIITDSGKTISLVPYMLGWEEKHKVHVFSDAVKMWAAADFVNHGDMHLGNYGVIRDNGENRAALIDFSRSLEDMGHVNARVLASQENLAIELEVGKDILSQREEIIAAIDESAENLKAAGLDKEYVESFRSELHHNMVNRFSNLEEEVYVSQFVRSYIAGHSVKRYLSDIGKLATTDSVPYIEMAFRMSIMRQDNNVFERLLPLMAQNPSYMSKAFAEAVKSGRDDMFEKMLSLMRTDTDNMREAFAEAIKSGRDDMFEKMLPLMVPSDIAGVFVEAVRLGKIAMFEKILPFIGKNPDRMREAFTEAVKSGRDDMLGEMLPLLPYIVRRWETGYLSKAFAEAVKSGKDGLFEKMLPYMAKSSNPNHMSEALAEAVKLGRSDIFDKMFISMKTKPSSMATAFVEVIREERDDMFKKMLPFMQAKPFEMRQAFTEAIKLGRNDMFEKLLLVMQMHPNSMYSAFIEAASSGRDDMLVEMLPFMKTDSTSMERAAYEAVTTGRITILKQVLKHSLEPIALRHIDVDGKLLNMAKGDAELFIGLLDKCDNREVVEALHKALPELLQSQAFKQKAIAAAKALNNKDILALLGPLPQQVEEPSTLSKLASKLDFLPNFPGAEASSEMRPILQGPEVMQSKSVQDSYRQKQLGSANADLPGSEMSSHSAVEVPSVDISAQTQLGATLFKAGKMAYSGAKRFIARNLGPTALPTKAVKTKERFASQLGKISESLEDRDGPIRDLYNTKLEAVNELYERRRSQGEVREGDDRLEAEYAEIKVLNDNLFEAKHKLGGLEEEVSKLGKTVKVGHLKQIKEEIKSLAEATRAIEQSAPKRKRGADRVARR